jgi:benzoyl-CoA reductase/2-hydroxyglutaryl-CoA dehydratase subunit BcrC/BadD/HgdB
MRPESMQFFDRVNERSLLEYDTVKQAGKIVVGIYCTFAPLELVRAAGAVPVGLCGKKQKPIPDAEKTLPANLCPLIKSSYGYAVTDTCPYFAFSDLLVGETTCDGKVKMYELLGRIKPLFLMNLPRTLGSAEQRYWLNEIHRFTAFLQSQTGIEVETEELRRQIVLHNAMRRALKELVYVCADSRAALSGYDLMIVQEAKSFAVDLQEYIDAVVRLTREVSGFPKDSDRAASRKRILLTGCPVGKGSGKVLNLIEECGARVVCLENCTGFKSFDLLVDEDDEPFSALARRYLQTPCSVMTPNEGRFESLDRLIRELKIDGVVDLTWHCCHTYNLESHRIKEHVGNVHSLPMLHIETDYSESDVEQLRTRIEAFLEMVQ